jgi:hypothetical protein
MLATAVPEEKDEEPSLGILLLRDIQRVFGEISKDRIFAKDLLGELHDISESPWSYLHGRELDERRLSKRLSVYGIRPKALRINSDRFKGYEKADFSRCVEPLRGGETPSPGTVTAETPVTGHEQNSQSGKFTRQECWF